MKRLSLVLFAVFALTLCGFAQEKTAPKKKEAKPAAHKMAGGGPDLAYLQKAWDAWGTMDTKNVAPYYVSGAGTFFDVAPLKYSSFEEYQAGAQGFFKDLKSVKFTVNDDAKVHGEGNWAWSTATVKEEATTKSGKHEMSTFRWTAIFEKTGDKWLITHEHISAPAQ
jgi:ketosteroid isomerase-like protein